MCDPMSIAGTVMSVASMAVNASNANSVQSARNSAMQAERDRQRQLDAERNALVDGGRQRYTGFEEQQTGAAKTLGDMFRSNSAGAPAESMVGPGAGNVAVIQERGKQAARVSAYGAQQDQALGQLRAFGDVLGDIGVKQARDAGTIGQLNGFSRGSADVLPYELEAANAKRGSGLLGDVLNLGGRVGIAAGLGGKPSVGGWSIGGGGASP